MEVASRMEVVLGARDVMNDPIPLHPLGNVRLRKHTYMLGSIHGAHIRTLLERIFERHLQPLSIQDFWMVHSSSAASWTTNFSI